MLNQMVSAIPNVVAALLLLILAWSIAAVAKGIDEKVFVKMGVHKGLTKTKIAKDEDHGKDLLTSVGKVIS
ncbi:hypothetical protein SH601_07920 [Gracilibacillus sp. S3-1-1]|uniref:Uncharacterized protein n=1 Tax=Gracilibacillus pellucidus TaxID=3095368 RepID=A0ACC6M4W2_9BACI|nr:hypothetical protein [Gracilibacillus sp. S3-1-1]MDX8045918.1 hypothetical protein [Gracilibacillus sp. S3-1-1]